MNVPLSLRLLLTCFDFENRNESLFCFCSGLQLGYGALVDVLYLTRYLLMFMKWRTSGWRLVVQGKRPSLPSPISHLLVSALMSRVTCSLTHASTQAWKRLCSRVLTRSCDCREKTGMEVTFTMSYRFRTLLYRPVLQKPKHI